MYPCGQPHPLASSVNFIAGDLVPNAVLAKLGDNRSVCISPSPKVVSGVMVPVSKPLPSGLNGTRARQASGWSRPPESGLPASDRNSSLTYGDLSRGAGDYPCT